MKKRFMLSIAAVTVLAALLVFFQSGSPVETVSDAVPLPVDRPTRPEISVSDKTAANPETENENRISYRLVSAKLVGYGDGNGQMGFISETEQETAGPESFAADGNGNFVVADTLNQKIHVLNTEGAHAEFDLPPDIATGDVAVFRSESIVVYDYAGRLHQFDFDGHPMAVIEFDRDRWDARLEMRIVNSNVFVQCADQIDHLAGILENGLLRFPVEEEFGQFDGTPGAHGASGRKYVARLERWERGWMDVREPGGEPAATLPLEVPGIVSARFLGEDSARNVFVQVERVENERVVLEVHRFDSQGKPAATVVIPENDYHFWTAKLLSVDAGGNIYQSLPQPDGMKFSVFQPFNPGEL